MEEVVWPECGGLWPGDVVRGLSAAEYDALVEIEEDTSRACLPGEEADDEFHYHECLEEVLIARGLIRDFHCHVCEDMDHVERTDLGRIALLLARTIPELRSA
jgi:hypothetical protein